MIFFKNVVCIFLLSSFQQTNIINNSFLRFKLTNAQDGCANKLALILLCIYTATPAYTLMDFWVTIDYYAPCEINEIQCTWITKQCVKSSNSDEIYVDLKIPYFSIDNAHLMYNAHAKLFRHSFWCIDNAHDAN